MALAGKLLVLLAVALLAVSIIAEHKVFASGTEEHEDNVYRVSKGGQGSLKIYQCKPACEYRCSDTKYRKPCLFFCNKCCNTCLCVPSGLYGHKYECGCYNDWKTKEGRPKCP
ncbi:gibberellin-regulated protein 12-like [Triticum urartu]|uniref:Gibberellin-regulated protein 6 n=1 Tax=Triticum urartu TaxID=4572 RepID=A0A8R7QI52_TRIUA|nr:gibberellin-regulated protein 12-like [Triticum urartu]XP_048574873.1 gibberellin-regulated protein 12-like [Triticum urartu]